MASDSTAAQEFHRMQLVQSISNLAVHLRECATQAENYIHALGYNVAPYVPVAPPNGQFAAMPMMPVMPMAQDEQGKKRKSRGDDPEGKKRANKKTKDPNAPKRPASSYLLFQNDVRQELKAKNPTMRNNELLSAIAKMWAEMPQEQKDAYEARNRAAKDQWLAQKAIYEGKLGAAVAVPAEAAPAAVAAPLKPVVPPPPAAATPSSAEESTGEDDDSSSDDSSEDDDAPPPPKKSKRDSAKDESSPKKEKKHKKSKA